MIGLRRAERPTGATGPFVALRARLYRRLWIGSVFVNLGVTAQGVARAWLAYELTGSNAGLGGVLLAFGLPMLVATPWGGVMADRLSKRAIVTWSVALLAVSSGSIGVAVLADRIEYWMLLAASAVQAVAFALYGPARIAYITELVEPTAVANAIVLGQMSAEATRVVAPAIAGVVIGAVADGTAGVLLVSSALTTVAMVTVAGLPPGRPSSARPKRSPWAEMQDGFVYVHTDPALRLMVLTSLGVVVVGFPYLGFLPTIAEDLFDAGSTGYGLISAVSAAGAVAAALFAGRLAARDPWRLTLRAGVVFGIGEVVLGLAPSFGVALVAIALVGAASLSFRTTNQSLLMRVASFEYHGRVQSIAMLGFSGYGVAALPLGVLADAIGLRATLVAMGAIVLTVVLVSGRRSGPARGRLTALDLG